MTDWLTYKGNGVWNFIEQSNKWGYLNNPSWTAQPEPFVRGGEHDYDGRESEEPQVWTPANQLRTSHVESLRHHQCGHWHKVGARGPRYFETELEFFQESADVYDGKIAIVGQIVDDPGGIGAVIYEPSDGKWYALGGVHNMSMYMEPNTCRIAGDYVYFFCSFIDYNFAAPYMYLGVFRFSHDTYPLLTILWRSEAGGDPYYVDDYQIYNAMDAQGSRIVALARVMKEGGIALNKFQVKVSNDDGETFPTTWTFPNVTSPNMGGYWDRCQIRMSEDGLAWIAYLRSAGALGQHMIELWKSNAGVTSFSKVWETNFYADLNNNEASTFIFDISEADGQYVMIRLNRPPYQVIYESRNYGVAFNTHTASYAYPAVPKPYVGKGIANADIILHGATVFGSADLFFRSTDYGVSFPSYDPTPIAIDESYVDEQKWHDQFIHVECGEPFYPPAASDDFISVLFSDDEGATWEVNQSPLPAYLAPGETGAIELSPLYYDTPDDTGVTVTYVGGGEQHFAFPQGLFDGLDYESPRWTYFWF